MILPWGSLVSILPLESIQSHSSGLYSPYKKPPQIFCDVGRGMTAWHITLRRQAVTIDY